jgi:hypothetical protein
VIKDIQRNIAVILTAAAGLYTTIDPSGGLRVPVVLAFAFLAPGLAFTRFVPNLTAVDRMSLVGAVSMGVSVVVTLFLVQFDAWTPGSAFVTVGVITLLACVPRSVRVTGS